MTRKHNPDAAAHAELHALGVTEPARHEAATRLMALGVPRGKLLGWVRQHGGVILDVLVYILDLLGGLKVPDPDVPSPPAPGG